MRKSSGLRNKYRSGRSTYNVKNKSAKRDVYGSWTNGTQIVLERINGTVLSYDASRASKWKGSS